MKAVLHWFPVALGVVFLLVLGFMQRERALRGENDFVQLYVGAKLAGTPELYSREANQLLEKATIGFVMDSVVYTRPPFYAALLKPLSWLPYRVAYAVFSLASLASILWFVIRFSKECSPLVFFASMSIPALAALCGGQDSAFLLVILAGSILLTRQKRDFLAGMLLSLCAIKFHLFLFVPLLLLLKKRWSILGGGVAGTAILTVLGIVVDGPGALPQYIKVLRDPWINYKATVMPNLHGLVATLHGDARMEFALIAIVAAGFLWTLSQTENYEFLFAASLVAGLLVSFHSGMQDDLILLPAFVLVTGSCTQPALRVAAALILTPVPYFMVMADAPYSAIVPVALLLMLGLFLTAGRGAGKTMIAEPVAC